MGDSLAGDSNMGEEKTLDNGEAIVLSMKVTKNMKGSSILDADRLLLK